MQRVAAVALPRVACCWERRAIVFVVLAEPLRSASELIRERAAERGVPCGVEVCKTLRVVLEVGPEVLSDGHAAGPGLRFR